MKTAAQYLHIKHSGDPLDREKCLVLSDMHIGASYADQKEAEALLKEQLSDPNLKHCVLLGDIFECLHISGKYDSQKFSNTADQYMDYLRKLVKDYPHVSFHYVIGNHERLAEFDQKADALAKEFPQDRLSVTRHFLKIGDGLFIHGDQAMDPKHLQLPDEIADHFEPNDPRYKASYTECNRPDWIQNIRDVGNVYAPWWIGRALHRPEQCAQKIFEWAHAFDDRNLSQEDKLANSKLNAKLSVLPRKGILSGIRHIFMGHTHDPFTASEQTDKTTGKSYHLYNSGAPIFRTGINGLVNRHCFNAMNFYLSAENKIDEVHSVKWPKHHWVNPKSAEASSHIQSLLGQGNQGASIGR